MQTETAYYKFFSNAKCEYFPCHEGANPEGFNCLFCYCPLYALGEACGGNFVYTNTGLKDCSRCMIPHNRAAYDYIFDRFNSLAELAKKEKIQ